MSPKRVDLAIDESAINEGTTISLFPVLVAVFAIVSAAVAVAVYVSSVSAKASAADYKADQSERRIEAIEPTVTETLARVIRIETLLNDGRRRK